MKKTIVAAGIASAVALFAAQANAASTLTYASWVPWTHPININLYIPWMNAIEKASNGEVKFRRLPKGIGHPRAYLDAVRTGQIDAGFSVHGYSPKRFAAYLFGEMPFLGDRAVASSVALQRTHEKFFASKNYYPGTKLIGMNTHGPGLIHHSKKHIMSPADMKGQKMRTGGPIPKRIVEAWGGVPIRQPAPKSYEILSTGIADGITFPYESLVSFRILKLVPYSTYIPGGLYSSTHYLVMNQKKYDALSAAGKKAVDQHSGQNFAKMGGQAWDKINDEGLAAAKKAGNKIVTAPKALVDAVKDLNKKFEAEYFKAAAAKGIDGKAVLEFYRAEVAKLQGK